MSVDQMVNQIRFVNPKFNQSTSSLRGVFAALASRGGVNPAELQRALDGIKLQDAMRYRVPLQTLVNDNPKVCYLNVEAFTYPVTPPTSQGFSFATDPTPSNRRIRYTSAKLTANATVYAIAPAATVHHEIGFIQHCTAKNDESTYSDGSGMKDACRLAFPVGDAPSDPSQHPWYCKGQSLHCAQPSWKDLMGKAAGSVHLEMNDSFDNNFHPYHSYAPAGMVTWARLQTINRAQSFKLWLVHERPHALKRLLRELAYTINVKVTTDQAGGIASFSSTVSDIRVRTPSLSEMIPACSGPSMNDQSEWRYKTPNGGWGASSHP